MFFFLVYQDGTVCISILHAPGDDPNMYESSSERWSPVQSVEKILLSVLSMLAEPNDESGANIECCVSIPSLKNNDLSWWKGSSFQNRLGLVHV